MVQREELEISVHSAVLENTLVKFHKLTKSKSISLLFYGMFKLYIYILTFKNLDAWLKDWKT